MTEFEGLIVVLLAAVILAALARKAGVPYPAFLALGGAVLAFLPGTPALAIEPRLALALFVAPVLLDAAYDASPRDLGENWVPLLNLAVVSVGLTTAAVAWVVHALVPAIPWAAAIALGAIVSPPDAAAATAVLRHVRLPHRLLTILEGESLLNDASALLIYRVALVALAANAFAIRSVAPAFLLAVVGSLVAGPLAAVLYLRMTRNVRDVPTAIILQFIGTFGIWILAERIGLSAILTMVSYAVTISRRAPAATPARLRIPSYAVWETVVFVLNVLAFAFIGLQIRPIVAGLDPRERVQYVVVAVAVLATVILVRFAWAMTYYASARWRQRSVGPSRRRRPGPSLGGVLIVSWCGMRGIVTLAAALALPLQLNGGPFPFRDLIVVTAFAVVLGTLVIQGLTLGPLLGVLNLEDDRMVEREVALARERVMQAALATFGDDASDAVRLVRQEFVTHVQRSIRSPGEMQEGDSDHDEIHRRALAAARRTLLELRESADIGDDAFHVLEEEFDWIEMGTIGRDDD